MEDKTYMIPPFGGKSILRSTKEEVEIIDCCIESRGERSNEDWVSYIDSNGNEHIKEHLNVQFDFKPVINDTWNSMFDWTKNKMPTTRNCRIFETAKEVLVNNYNNVNIEDVVYVSTKLVDTIGIETQ